MTDTVARFGMNLLLCAVAIPAIAAQSEQTSSDTVAPSPATDAPPAIVYRSLNLIRQAGQSPESGEPVQGEQQEQKPKGFFVFGQEANEFAQRMKERLSDPAQRAALRAEQRALFASLNAGVGRVVGLDPATEQKLMDLLTDQQMEQLEQRNMSSAQGVFDLHQHAAETTQRMNALSNLLGDEKLERYQAFTRTQPMRHWVSQFSSRLAPEDRLQPHQEDRLVALKQEEFDALLTTGRPRQAFPQRRVGPQAGDELQQQFLRGSTNSWFRRQAEIPVLEQKAAAFLTPTQLAELSKFHAREQDSVRRYIESARAQAGLDPSFPETPEVEEAPVLIEAQLQIEVNMTVNRETTTVLRTVRSGEPFTFQPAPGLIVEATPAMYEQDWVELQLNFFEDGATGRRRLPDAMTTTSRLREFEGPLATGGNGSVVAGRRGYAVETNFRAKVL